MQGLKAYNYDIIHEHLPLAKKKEYSVKLMNYYTMTANSISNFSFSNKDVQI